MLGGASLGGRNLPPRVLKVYSHGYLRRSRRLLVAILDAQRRADRGGGPAAVAPECPERSRRAPWPQSRPSPIVAAPEAPDLWSEFKRTASNPAAMRLAASKRPRKNGHRRFPDRQVHPRRSLREEVLERPHLSTAFRLPAALIAGARLVTDPLHLPGGELGEEDEGDRFVLEGDELLLLSRPRPRHRSGP